MVNNTKQALEKINEVSRQLLSHILVMQNNIQGKPTAQDEPPTNKHVTDEQLTDDELTVLMSERKILITRLFEQSTAEDISLTSALVEEMLALDSELTNKSQACKQALAEQIIKLKKSKKVAKSYQQY